MVKMVAAEKTTIEERDGHVWIAKKSEEPSGRCELCKAERDVKGVCEKRIQVLEWMLGKAAQSWRSLHDLEDDVAKYTGITVAGSIVCCGGSDFEGRSYNYKLNIKIIACEYKKLVEKRAKG
jgi:hypothetical protein